MAGPATPSPREHLAAFASLAPRVTRAAWVGGIALAVGLVATAIWALSTSRLYQSEAVLLYERGVQSSQVGSSGEADGPRQVGLRIQDMMTSRQRLESAVREMKLYPGIVSERSVVDAIDEMRKHINVGIREGYAFRVSYNAESRDLAQKVLERLSKGVIEDDGKRRIKEAEDAKKFLDTERAHADETLHLKEAALTSFLAQHPALAAETAIGGASAGGSIRAANRDSAPAAQSEVASLELQAAQLEQALIEAGQKPSSAGGSLEPMIDPNVAAARLRAQTEVLAAQKDLADKQARYTNEHPDVKAALRRLGSAEAALRHAEAAAAVPPPPRPAAPVIDDGSAGKVNALRHALAAVRAQIGAVRGRAAPKNDIPKEKNSMVAIDTEWTRLTREAAEAHERQSQLEAKQFQATLMATLAGTGQAGRIIIADPPFRPTRPIAGGRFKIALVGGIASILLALLSLLAMAAFDDRLYVARDVERIMENSIVIAIPRLPEKAG
jgi:uncharacterized protein involved in exopolysaccharide biosynthesis